MSYCLIDVSKHMKIRQAYTGGGGISVKITQVMIYFFCRNLKIPKLHINNL